MESESKFFCPKPFTWFEVSTRGDVFVCCPSWLKTPIGNLNQQSFDEVWNGPVAQDIRRSILDGSFEYCSFELCPYLHTRPNWIVTHADDVTDSLMLSVIRDGLTVLPFGPRDINCCYDRSCNLSCPSCRTAMVNESSNSERILNIQQKLNDHALADAKLLYITGSGDPFGSPFFRTWLYKMKRSDMPNLETLHLHTNAQLWTPRMWNPIPEDIRALIRTTEISIDAASAATYEVNRRGGKWDVLLRNLEFVSELRQSGPLTWLGISMVVQDNNFEEMPDFVRLGRRIGADMVYFSQLVNWGTFSEAEFEERAVHRAEHPRNLALRATLKDSIFTDSLVNLGNLSPLRVSSDH
jgi:MoaA/NifB/PqqE/SkfB family radical SAM enzyme